MRRLSAPLPPLKTQFPYALVCMIAATLAGYLPAAFGMPVWISYAVELAGLVLLLFVFGKNPEGK